LSFKSDRLKQLREELNKADTTKISPGTSPPLQTIAKIKTGFLQEMDFLVRCFDAFGRAEHLGETSLLNIPQLIESVRKTLESTNKPKL